MAPAVMIQSPDGSDMPANQYKMTYRGTATFDVAKGHLVQRDYLVETNATASSLQADGFGGVPYVQAVHLEYVPAGADAPAIGESVALPPSDSAPSVLQK
jgi:hypothetical protein